MRRWLPLLPSGAGIALCLAVLASTGAPAAADPLAMYARQASAFSVATPRVADTPSLAQIHAHVLRVQARLERHADFLARREARRDRAQAAARAAAAAAAAAAAQQQAPAPAAVQAPASGVGGAFGACVRAAENGGSYSWSTGNGGGAYQFLASTWAKYAPAGAVFGSASPAQQDQAFMNAIATPGGYLNWSPYDGCWP